jgi:hypothetical protein
MGPHGLMQTFGNAPAEEIACLSVERVKAVEDIGKFRLLIGKKVGINHKGDLVRPRIHNEAGGNLNVCPFWRQVNDESRGRVPNGWSGVGDSKDAAYFEFRTFW